jgi:hypothetical protein
MSKIRTPPNNSCIAAKERVKIVKGKREAKRHIRIQSKQRKLEQNYASTVASPECRDWKYPLTVGANPLTEGSQPFNADIDKKRKHLRL